MSFKDGIPLLTTLEDDDEEDGEVVAAEVDASVRYRLGRKRVLIFAVVAVSVISLLVIALAVAVSVAVVVTGGSGASSEHVETLVRTDVQLDCFVE